MDQARLAPFEAFDLAVTRAGGQSALARICDCTPGNINQLLQAKRWLPAEYVLKVEAATHVARHDLRPDIYPRGLQDDVPFVRGAGGAALDELPSDDASPEWPLAADADESLRNSGTENQNAAGRPAVSSAVDEASTDTSASRPAAEQHQAAGADE